MSDKNLTWYAVYTKPRWEKKIAEILTHKGIEHYCPLHKVVRQWSDRKKVLLEPLFKSYIFVKTEDIKKWDIKNINGILNFVYWLGKPAQIREDEINRIRKFLNEFSDARVEKINFHLNSKVRIKQGILMNYEGIVMEISGNRAIVKIENLDLQLNARFDKKHLETIQSFFPENK